MNIPISNPDRFKNILAFLLVGSFISTIPSLLFKSIPEANTQVVTYMLGQLSGMASSAIGFYFITKAGADALDAKRADTTARMADAVVAAAASTPPINASTDVVSDVADAVAGAAADKADEIKEGN